MYAYEADLINPVARGRSRSTLSSHEYALATIAMRCLEASNAYFEAFLTIQPSEYPQLSLNQWFGLTYAAVMLFKLCLAVARVPVWDVELARSLVPFQWYMEQSIDNIKAALHMSGHKPDGSEHKDLYSMNLSIWEDTLAAYRRKSGMSIEERLSSSSLEVHQKTLGMVKSPARRSTAHPCPAYSIWK
jgi:hypothetical protein